jgi:hypothetical protein
VLNGSHSGADLLVKMRADTHYPLLGLSNPEPAALTDSSITALALEESLLKRWSEFHSRIEEFKASPATRDEAERVSDYSRDTAFVDSVVDALSLYLAGRSEFDAKFGSYLDLMLIQRAHDEDIVVLQKLAGKYAQDANIVGLLGLVQRMRLYSGDERLKPLIDFCFNALDQLNQPVDNATWAQSVGIAPTAESWSIGVRLGTSPPHYWLARRDELKRDDVSVELLVANSREWRIQAARVDRLYSAQWRPSGITVATEDLRFKSLTAWPSIASQRLFPLFALRLADYLHVNWSRTAWLTTHNVEINRPMLLEWLHSSVDELRP